MTTTSRKPGAHAVRRTTAVGVAMGVGALVVAAALGLGGAHAYFSDAVTGAGSSTAGSFDVQGTLALEKADGLTPDAYVPDVGADGELPGDGSLDNVNPGDIIRMSGTIENLGSKSAWVRPYVNTQGSVGTDIAGDLYVYTGSDLPDQAELWAASEADTLTTLPGYLGTVADLDAIDAGRAGTPVIVDGSAEADAPTPTREYAATVIVYFDRDAPNADQGQGFGLQVDVQAVQYRNNTHPELVDWTTLERGSFDGTGWVPAG